MAKKIFSCKTKASPELFFLDASEHLPVCSWYPDELALMKAREWLERKEQECKGKTKLVVMKENAILAEFAEQKRYSKIMSAQEKHGQITIY